MFDSMNEINCPYPLSISTDEEREQISDEVMHFNARAVPFTQKDADAKKDPQMARAIQFLTTGK